MDFAIVEEHALLREIVQDFYKRELPRERIREFDRNGTGPPDDILAKMAELGWLGLTIPGEYDGGGADVMTAAVLIEELARGWASLASDLVLTSMASGLLTRFGTEEQRQTVLPGLARGEMRIAFSLSEPSGGTDVLNGTTSAELDGSEWVIQGQKLYTSRAHEAAQIIVLARTDAPTGGKKARGWSLIMTPRDQEEIQVRKLDLLGFRSAGTTEVFYDAARAPEDGLIGERGRGFYHLLASLNNERITAAAIGIGIAQAAFDEALQYATERQAFGRPIGAFQALQHSLADTATELEQARLLVQKAAWLEMNGRECAREAAMANVAAGELAVRATDRGMRILAGHGMNSDSPMERYLRDARLQVFSPVSNEMGRNFIGESYGLPRSY